MTQVIAVEGISGVGKTSFIKEIQTKFPDKKIHVIKQDYYDAIIKQSINMNHEEAVLLFLSLHKHIQYDIERIKNDYDVILLDRSIVSTLVYGDLYQMNFCYDFLHEFKYQNYPIDHVIILQNANIEECFNRIKKKNRYETIESMTKYNKSYLDHRLWNVIKFIAPKIQIQFSEYGAALNLVETLIGVDDGK